MGYLRFLMGVSSEETSTGALLALPLPPLFIKESKRSSEEGLGLPAFFFSISKSLSDSVPGDLRFLELKFEHK